MARRSGSVAAAALFAALVLGATAPAEAASRFCRQLEAQLAEPQQSAQLETYERAVEEQYAELTRAERRAERAGCFGGYYHDNPLCPGLLGTLERMDRNLIQLERRRDLLARRGDARRERARIMAALEANRCREDEQEVRILPPPIDSRDAGLSGNVLTGPFSGETFRTLCVRTCDGYYFPISFSVTPDQFARDEQKCRAMCPGTEVQLYSHRMPGEESKDMVSGAGTPYTELPNAFQYRQAGYVRPEGCGCSPPKNFSVIAGGAPKDATSDEQPAGAETQVLVPTPRPDPDAPPETLAAEATAGDAAEPDAKEKEREIRVVGPRFLPDPEGAIDLRSPGRPDAQ